jgi:hypothetical protein
MSVCSGCGSTIAAGFGFCGACGAATAAGGAGTAVARGEPPARDLAAICAGCGILADPNSAACATCAATYPTPRPRAALQPGGGYWAAVRLTFKCNMCRFDVPLNHYEPGDAVVCSRCGLEQRYETVKWAELVRFAHEVADVGRDRDLLERVDARWARELEAFGWVTAGGMRVTLGNPLCPACRSPVVVATSGAELLVGCSRCPEQRRYERFFQLACKGVLSEAHEDGRSEAIVSGQGGVTLLRCPNCSAPLEGVGAGDVLVTCNFCKVTCRISARARAKAGHTEVPAKTWWLYFDEPTLRRTAAIAEAKRQAERDAWAARHPGPRPVAPGAAERSPATPRMRARARLSLASSALLAVVTVAGWGFVFSDAFDEVTCWIGAIACSCVGALAAWAAVDLAYRVAGRHRADRAYRSTWWLPIAVPAFGGLVALYRAAVLFHRSLASKKALGAAGLPLAFAHLALGPYLTLANFTLLAALVSG